MATACIGASVITFVIFINPVSPKLFKDVNIRMVPLFYCYLQLTPHVQAPREKNRQTGRGSVSSGLRSASSDTSPSSNDDPRDTRRGFTSSVTK